MPTRRTRSLLSSLAATVALGCGDDDQAGSGGDESEIRLVTAAYLQAYADNSPDACELLSASSRARIELSFASAGNQPRSCEQVIERYSGEPLDAEAIRASAERIDEAQISIAGDYARVDITTGKAPILALFLERVADPVAPNALGRDVEWLVDDTENTPS